MNNQDEFDVCVVGSGFGGTLAAQRFVEAGSRVLMLERGDWVRRGPHNWAPDGTGDTTPYYNRESAYRVVEGGNQPSMGAYNCVGGPSVFYGGVSLRFREADFAPPASIVGEAGAAWPLDYAELAPYYDQAERLLDVAGQAGDDPTEPARAAAYPQNAAPLSEVSAKLAAAGAQLGLKPFRLPLAINYRAGERACQLCSTCDTYACAVSAKNDLASTLIPALQRRGMQLRPNSVVVRLICEGKRLVAAEVKDRVSGKASQVRARFFVLAAGALASPLLILASGLDKINPAGNYVGRFLMRHANAIVFGLFPRLPGRLDTFHKQIGFHDFYFGGGAGLAADKAGALQQIHSPPVALVKLHLGAVIGAMLSPLARRMTGLLAIAEDQPNVANHVRLSSDVRDRFGLPQLEIEHRYSPRDLAALKLLTATAKRILRKSGALLFYTHHIRTFSHAVGTLRMGNDASKAPLDAFGMFRGVENLLVSDGSVFPTAAAVNPSLTISALALRAADRAVRQGVVR